MLSATFHDLGSGDDDPDFSVDLTRSTATFRTPEILYIIRRNCYTSQGDPDSSFPYLVPDRIKCSLLRDKYFCKDSKICSLCWKSLNMRSEWGNINTFMGHVVDRWDLPESGRSFSAQYKCLCNIQFSTIIFCARSFFFCIKLFTIKFSTGIFILCLYYFNNVANNTRESKNLCIF